MIRSQSIQHRLVLYVSLGLLLFSLLAGGVIYRLAFNQELAAAASLERQLVNTVNAQAEVALFAANRKIAEGVIEGLRANPRILAARISSDAPGQFSVGAGATALPGEATITEYSLHSPVEEQKVIGQLAVTRNDALIRAEATMHALRQVLLMSLQILATAVLIVLFSRQLIGKPVTDLADRLAAIRPGSGARIDVAAQHAHDEIGSVAASANALLQQAEDALAEVQALASTDALTGLPNRRAFMARLDDEHARVKRYEAQCASVLMLDIDHFKRINDNYGHGGGDAVLRHFGKLLADALRKVDCAGRIGGEEFAVLLPGADIPAAMMFAERLRAQVAATPIRHEAEDLRMTISIGVASLASTDVRPDDALVRADAALYQAKNGGRNRVVANDASA